jgi:hypothetical protein
MRLGAPTHKVLFYGMARPSFGTVRSAVVQEEEWAVDIAVLGVDLASTS